jgi:hypothetical protein
MKTQPTRQLGFTFTRPQPLPRPPPLRLGARPPPHLARRAK